MVPEDRKAEGVIADLSVRDNIVLAALPRLTTAGFVSSGARTRSSTPSSAGCGSRSPARTRRSASCPAATSRRCCWPGCCACTRRCCILDEPTRGIDVGAKAEIQALIDELAAQGLGVLLISSELEEVVEGADRVLVLRDGAVVGTLRGDEISEDRIMHTIAAASDEAAAATDERWLTPR